MHIVHVIDYFQPTLGYQETYLAKEQIKAGHKVSFVTSDRYFPFPNYNQSYLKILGQRRLKSGVLSECGFNVQRLKIAFEIGTKIWLRDLKKTLNTLSPDIVFVHGLTTLTAIRISQMEFSDKCKVIYDDHMSGTERRTLMRKTFEYVFNLLFKKRIENKAWKIFAISICGINYLKDIFNIKQDKLEHLPLGYDSDVFYRSENLRNSHRAKYMIPAKAILGVYTGKINTAKGILELTVALSRLLKKYPYFYFAFIGEGSTECINSIKKIKSNRIFHLPFQKAAELNIWYNAADFAIWPNGVTVSHYEAIGTGLPIIVSPWEMSKERVSHDNGIVLESCKIECVYKSIDNLIKNIPELKRLESNAVSISSNFSWRKLNRQCLRCVE